MEGPDCEGAAAAHRAGGKFVAFAAEGLGTILIDEWQRRPESWDYVRRAVDGGAAPGRFLLTGSATPAAGTDTHSGAGRILSLRMRPLALFERAGAEPSIRMRDLFAGGATIAGETGATLKDYIDAIASGGFPGFYEAPPVPAWDMRRSPFAGLAKAPKHQLADPAFALRLLDVPAAKLTTRFSYLLGPLFESLATLSVRVAAQASFGTVGHFRTVKGDREVDLIAQDQDGAIVAFEVKLAANIGDDDVKHLLWLREKLPDDVVDTVILTTGTRAYRRPDGVAVVPLALLGA